MIPPGFVFQPTDQELVVHYLRRWIHNQLPLLCSPFEQKDVYSTEPDKLLGGRQQAYFLTFLRPSKSKSARVPRKAGNGTWFLNTSKEGNPVKVPGTDGGEVTVGYKRNLSFYLCCGKKKSTGFVMDEYALSAPARDDQGQPVLCVIRQTQRSINLNAAKRKRSSDEPQMPLILSSPLPPSTPVYNYESLDAGAMESPEPWILEPLAAITPEVEDWHLEVHGGDAFIVLESKPPPRN